MADETQNPDAQQPEQGVPPALHIVRVTHYEDDRGIAVFERETVFGVAPRGYPRFVFATAVPVQTPQGMRPLNVQGPLDGAQTAEDAFAMAPDAIKAAAEEQLNAMREQSMGSRIVLPGGVRRR